MIWLIVSLFGLAAVIGGWLLNLVLSDKRTPKGVALMHGLVAAAALLLLIVYVVGHRPGPLEALIVFAIAALGGAVLFVRDIADKPVPKWLGLVHGLAATAGFVLLLVFLARPVV